jgi:hypothetical protein
MSPVTPMTPMGAPPSSPGGLTSVHAGGSSGSGRSRRLPLVVLVLALAALIGSVAAVPWLSGQGRAGLVSPTGLNGQGRIGLGPGMMGGGGMMGAAGGGMMTGRVWLAGDGVPVASIAAARARAAQAAQPAGLHPGEVIWFANGFYVELKDAAGNPSTEVLVDPTGGGVSTEPGPAMMWNTGSTAATVSADQARTIAGRWLDANRPGEAVGSLDAYPGYYTVDTVAGSTTKAMLSVNAATGQVWYHTWHGAFIAKQDS